MKYVIGDEKADFRSEIEVISLEKVSIRRDGTHVPVAHLRFINFNNAGYSRAELLKMSEICANLADGVDDPK